MLGDRKALKYKRFNDLCYHSHSDLPSFLNKPYITSVSSKVKHFPLMDFICIYCALVWHGSSYGIVRAADGWVCKNHQMWLSELENTTGHLTSTFWTIVVLLVTTKTIRPVTSNAKICLLCSPLCYFSAIVCCIEIHEFWLCSTLARSTFTASRCHASIIRNNSEWRSICWERWQLMREVECFKLQW